MDRKPPLEVRQQLRREVGFGCAVTGCGSPYLYWHHFDPPWKEHQHHDPEGMIALCGEHHAKADVGAYTKEQLRTLKREAEERETGGRFDWMRNRLLAVVGGNFYYETPVILRIRGAPIIWFNRDADEHLLLNLRMPTTSGERRAVIEDNYWLVGAPEDVECPPSGRLVRMAYANGDSVSVEFFQAESEDELVRRYRDIGALEGNDLPFPITAVEVQMNVANTTLRFGPRETTLPGMGMLRGCFMSHCSQAIVYE
jgi:hypothetical protein